MAGHGWSASRVGRERLWGRFVLRSTTNERVGGDGRRRRDESGSRAGERIVTERQVSVCRKGTFQGGRGYVNGLAIEESVGNGFNAAAFGWVYVVVQMIRVDSQDLSRVVWMDDAGL